MVDDDRIKVVVTVQAGGKSVTTLVPSDTIMSRLIPALVTEMQLPTNVHYEVCHKQSGRQLRLSDTLAAAGVQEQDTLKFLSINRMDCQQIQFP